jgi:hypothetical protein
MHASLPIAPVLLVPDLARFQPGLWAKLVISPGVAAVVPLPPAGNTPQWYRPVGHRWCRQQAWTGACPARDQKVPVQGPLFGRAQP